MPPHRNSHEEYETAKRRMRLAHLPEVRAAAEREPDLVAAADEEPPEETEQTPEVDPARHAAMEELAAAVLAERGPIPEETGDAEREPASLSMTMFREAQGDGE